MENIVVINNSKNWNYVFIIPDLRKQLAENILLKSDN